VFVSPVSPTQSLAITLQKIIADAGTFAPRSQQIAIGPSEAGQECTRRLAYKLLDWDVSNPGSSSSWASQVGTAIHAYLAEVFGKLDEYEVEQRVKISGNLGGTVDLYHIPSGTVLDWKTTGNVDSKRRSLSKQNLVQVNLYALGKKRAGADVKQVALVYLPVKGDLSEMHIELHPFDEQMALDALDRIDNIYSLLATVDVESNPTMWQHIPAVSSRLCNYCPYFKPFSNDLAIGCNGETEPRNVS
jgi:hypothetical protein